MPKIRRFKLSDLKEIMEIEKSSFPHPWSGAYFKKLCKEHPYDFLVAELFGKSVGYILGYAKPNKLGLIKTLAVDQRRRHQGVGKELVNLTMQRLKQRGVKKVFLHTRKKNLAVNSFHKKMGFRVIKTIEKYYPNGDDAYLMRRES